MFNLKGKRIEDENANMTINIAFILQWAYVTHSLLEYDKTNMNGSFL